MIDTTILLSIALMLPAIVLLILRNVTLKMPEGRWLDIVLVIMLILGLIIMFSHILNPPTITTAFRIAK